jgi:Malectin domain
LFGSSLVIATRGHSFNRVGKRLFGVSVEERQLLDIDLVKMGQNATLRALTSVFTPVVVNDGLLTIRLMDGVPKLDNPKLSGIEVFTISSKVDAAPTKAPIVAPIMAPKKATAAPIKAPVSVPVLTLAPAAAPLAITAPAAAPVKSPIATATPVTKQPLAAPAKAPVAAPTKVPLSAPTKAPALTAPTKAPVLSATKAPVLSAPTKVPVSAPTKAPVYAPTKAPVSAPTKAPVSAPTKAPVAAPTNAPLKLPVQTEAPKKFPTTAPALAPVKPTVTFQPILINCGGDAYTDTKRQVWSADKFNEGGQLYATGKDILGTEDDELYRLHRWGQLTYKIPVPLGSYQVIFHSAEI